MMKNQQFYQPSLISEFISPEKGISEEYRTHNMSRLIKSGIIFSLVFMLVACGNNSDDPKSIAEQFWSSAQDKKLDEAKQLVSWETVDYLRYIQDEKLTISHVDLGEVLQADDVAKIDTVIVLKREKGDDIRIPTKTVLVKTEGVWRIQLKKTLATVLTQTVRTAANQFNQLFSEGLNELDKVLSESVGVMTKSLQQGAEELSKSLEENAEQFGNTLDEMKKELELPASNKSQ